MNLGKDMKQRQMTKIHLKIKQSRKQAGAELWQAQA